jgi:hypothetical protein
MTSRARSNHEGGITHEHISEDELRSMPKKNPNQAFILSEIDRPGFHPFATEVEYTMYEPDTERNALFELMLSEFPKRVMLWVILAIPIGDLNTVKEVAKKYGFTLVPDILPVCVDRNGPRMFPLDPSENIFCVQGILKDENLLREYTKHWDDVIEKHSKGIPWKV